MKKQIELLKKHGVRYYPIDGEKITINGSLDLSSIEIADKDFLKGQQLRNSEKRLLI